MIRLMSTLLVALSVTACTSAEAEPETAEVTAEPATESEAPQSPVELAMSAAPAAVSQDATIMQFDEAGELVELREGTNGWMCMPDENPAAPGNAPICVDGAWQEFFGAYMARENPTIEHIGISYMLEGGAFASNTDPFAEGPPEGEEWGYDGPHLMIIVPDAAMLDPYPTEHQEDRPYVMWAGTPYAHLMVPVAGG